MSTVFSFKEALERRGEAREANRDGSGSPVFRVRLLPRKIEQPVKVARLLAEHGMSLHKAHQTIDRLADGETVAVALRADDRDKLGKQLSSLGLEVTFEP